MRGGTLATRLRAAMCLAKSHQSAALAPQNCMRFALNQTQQSGEQFRAGYTQLRGPCGEEGVGVGEGVGMFHCQLTVGGTPCKDPGWPENWRTCTSVPVCRPCLETWLPPHLRLFCYIYPGEVLLLLRIGAPQGASILILSLASDDVRSLLS